jgi:hypothetical protein
MQTNSLDIKAQVPDNVADTGKVTVGGAAINLRKPAPKKQADVSDNGKVKIGGAAINLRKPAPKK